jgi:hypothetical protein
MTPVENFLHQLGQQGELQPQGKRTIFHYQFPSGGMLCFKTIRSSEQIRLHNIVVESPQQGVGTTLMELICDIADQCNVIILLTALPFGDPARRIQLFKLVSWYRNFGFDINDDYYDDQNTMDMTEGMEMIRDPR